jgi:peptidoglycan/LPS O-acetylase OafA/YrhL
MRARLFTCHHPRFGVVGELNSAASAAVRRAEGARGEHDSLRRFVRPRHRDDIQGLRAVAVLLVALDHAGVSFLKGGFIGVDVFFVLSGFLITQLLLSEAVESGRVSLINFYLRRARRILPAAALTLVVTVLAAYFLLNSVRARATTSDSIWAALFGSNINFSRQATDYFAQGQPPSAVLHFWSLSIEEQFYFVWPTLFSVALFGLVLRRFGQVGKRPVTEHSIRRLLLVASLVAIGSFVWSLHVTATSPNAAYFSSFARAWELGLGAVLAIATPALMRAPAWLRLVGGWAGLASIAVAATTLSGSTPFPGSAALLPTLGAALVIAAGLDRLDTRWSSAHTLSIAPLRYVGDRSYTLYLWHWPILVIAAGYEGHRLSLLTKLLLVLAALLLSSVTFRFYENPLRRMRWPRPAAVLLWPASAAAVLTVGLVCISAIDNKLANVAVAKAATQPAIVLSTQATKTPPALPAVSAAVRAAQRGAKIPSPLVPRIGQLEKDLYNYPDSRCVAHDGDTKSQICQIVGSNLLASTTSATAPQTPGKTLVLFGDSHAQMWMPTITTMAQQDGWIVIPLGKSRCNANRLFTRAGPANEKAIRAECRAWYAWALTQIKALHPDAVLISMGYSGASGSYATNAVNGITALVATAKKSTTHVLVMADTPYLSQLPEPVDCLLARGATMKTCTGAWSEQQLSITHAIAALAPLQHFSLIDTTGWLCFEHLCPPVVGHTIVYRDWGHVTKTYAQELTPTFRATFRRALARG